MRPPWIEAAALLAAHGHAVPSSDLYKRRKPPMPSEARYVLFTHPERADIRPRVFPDLRRLAAHVHQQRKGAAIELQDAPLELDGDAAPRPGVSVWTLSDLGERRCFMGWCYIDGQKRPVLEAALAALRPTTNARPSLSWAGA